MKPGISFEHIFDISPIAIVIHADWKILYANKAWKTMIGAKSNKEFIGQSLLHYIHPDYHEIVLQRVAQIYKTDKPVKPLREKYLRTDGSIIDVEARAQLITFNNNAAVISYIQDITLHKQNEDRNNFLIKFNLQLFSAFNDEKKMQRTMNRLIPLYTDICNIGIFDENQQIESVHFYPVDYGQVAVSRQLLHKINMRNNDSHGMMAVFTTGKPILVSQFTPKILQMYQDDPEIIQMIQQLHLTSYIGVPLIAKKNIIGVMAWLSTRSDRLFTKYDVAFAQELSYRIAISWENNRLYRKSIEAIQIRDEFISLASHELKTPLTSVKLYSQLIQHALATKQEPQLYQYSRTMNQQLVRLNNLIQDLLDISMIQAGHMKYMESKVNIDKLIKETVNNYQPLCPKHRLHIENKIHQFVRGDPIRLGQVFTNLISNAVKYSPEAVEVTIRLAYTCNQVTISVSDFGEGIAEDEQKYVFERYYRSQHSRLHTFTGMGIGLYLSKEIVMHHQGKIWVTSKLGEGATFYVSLPTIDSDKIKS